MIFFFSLTDFWFDFSTVFPPLCVLSLMLLPLNEEWDAVG